MRAQLEYYMEMSGESRDEDGDWEDESVEEKIDDAIKAMIGRNIDLIEMAEMLSGHGSLFTGNNVDDEAQGWLDSGFDTEDAGAWCQIGCWDAETAAEWRDAGMTPEQINDAADHLIDAELDRWENEDAQAMEDCGPLSSRESKYTDGSPIYAACNNDISADMLVEAVGEMANA